MSQTDPTSQGPQPDIASMAAAESFGQVTRAMTSLSERLTPWLVDFGSWMFAGFIAFILIVLAALMTIGPVDRAIIVSATAFAIALPLDVAGLFLLRLVQDLTRAGLSDEWARAFREAGFPIADIERQLSANGSRQVKRTQIVLAYCMTILALSGLLTLTGVVAALWHIAWWIGVIFIVMAIISAGVVVAAFVTLRPRDTPEERERQRRYWDDLLRRAQERAAQAQQAQPPDAAG